VQRVPGNPTGCGVAPPPPAGVEQPEPRSRAARHRRPPSRPQDCQEPRWLVPEPVGVESPRSSPTRSSCTRSSCTESSPRGRVPRSRGPRGRAARSRGRGGRPEPARSPSNEGSPWTPRTARSARGRPEAAGAGTEAPVSSPGRRARDRRGPRSRAGRGRGPEIKAPRSSPSQPGARGGRQEAGEVPEVPTGGVEPVAGEHRADRPRGSCSGAERTEVEPEEPRRRRRGPSSVTGSSVTASSVRRRLARGRHGAPWWPVWGPGPGRPVTWPVTAR